MLYTKSLLLFFILIPFFSHADMIIGGETVYHVVKGDTIELISSKLGLNQKKLIKDNNIDLKNPLQIGQELKVNNRLIVPKAIEDGIIINIPDRTLYFFKRGRLEMAFPVGLGMPSWRGITKWRTPVGEFEIIEKKENPTWYVPESMQWKMEMEGKPVKTIVPPGPDNPPRKICHEDLSLRCRDPRDNLADVCLSVQEPWMHKGHAGYYGEIL